LFFLAINLFEDSSEELSIIKASRFLIPLLRSDDGSRTSGFPPVRAISASLQDPDESQIIGFLYRHLKNDGSRTSGFPPVRAISASLQDPDESQIIGFLYRHLRNDGSRT
jgi:hypothetical protein